MPFGLDPLALIAVLAIAVAAVLGLAWLVARRGGKRPTHPLGREDSIAYFRDFGSSAPGVQEEDAPARWGGREGSPGADRAAPDRPTGDRPAPDPAGDDRPL